MHRIRAYDFSQELGRHHIPGLEPAYIFDTSAVIDLCRANAQGAFLPFLKGLNGNSIVPHHVWGEIEKHSECVIGGRRREICDAVLNEMDRIHERCTPKLDDIMGHPLYDTYRYEVHNQVGLVCDEKKVEDDPISATDKHVAAIALTLAAHGKDFSMEGLYPCVLASDAHITGPLLALKDRYACQFQDEAERERAVALAWRFQNLRICSGRNPRAKSDYLYW